MTEVQFILPWKPHVKIFYAAQRQENGVNVLVEVFAYSEFFQVLTSYIAMTKSMSSGGGSGGAGGSGGSSSTLPISTPSAGGGSGTTSTALWSLAAQLHTFVTHIVDTDRLLTHLVVHTALGYRNNGSGDVYDSKRFWRMMNAIGASSWNRWFVTERLEMIVRADFVAQAPLSSSSPLTAPISSTATTTSSSHLFVHSNTHFREGTHISPSSSLMR
jgi:hypothetical protein